MTLEAKYDGGENLAIFKSLCFLACMFSSEPYHLKDILSGISPDYILEKFKTFGFSHSCGDPHHDLARVHPTMRRLIKAFWLKWDMTYKIDFGLEEQRDA